MKKTVSWMLAAVMVAVLFALCGCGEQTFEKKSYASGEAVVRSVTLDVKDRTVEVSAWEGREVRLEYSESEKEYYEITLSDGTLEMKQVIRKNWTDYFGTKPAQEYRQIRLYVPDTLLSCLSVSTTNGDITLTSLSFSDDVSLSVNGGNVSFEGLEVGAQVSLTVKNGNISGSLVGGWDDFSIRCKVKKGDSNLPEEKTDGQKALLADCNNGNVQITFVPENG